MKSLLTSAPRFAAAAAPTRFRFASSALSGRLRQAALGVLLAGSALLAAPAVAQQQPVVVDKTDVATFRVRTQNPDKQRIQVRVKSGATGQELFAETYSQSHYSRRLNFQSLKPGFYTLTTKLGPDTYRYMIQVKATHTGQAVAVRNVRVRLGNASRQLEALNAQVPAATSVVAAK